MLGRKSMVGITTVLLITIQPVWAAKRVAKKWVHHSEKRTQCYRLSEVEQDKSEDRQPLDEILCISKGNLKLYPKSVVTFTLHHGSPSKLPHHRYHYKMLKKNEFGRKRMVGKATHSEEAKARVIFDERRKTVFLGFIKNGGKSFRYIALDERVPASESERK